MRVQGSIDFPGATLTWITGINPRGEILGFYLDADGNMHGFVLSNGNFKSIDIPGALFTEANGINPEGDIVGRYATSDGKVHGPRWLVLYARTLRSRGSQKFGRCGRLFLFKNGQHAML